MGRLTVGGRGPFETRAGLRRRLARHLPEPERFVDRTEREVIDDETMLRLLEAVSIEQGSAADFFRQTYAAAALNVVGAPDFDALVEEGWLIVQVGRVVMTRMARELIRADAQPKYEPLRKLLPRLYETDFVFPVLLLADPILGPIAKGLQEKNIRWDAIACRRPEWVAARLWERADRQEDAEAGLTTWLERWERLGEPDLRPSEVWNNTDADEFRSACLALLTPPGGIDAWTVQRRRLVSLLCQKAGATSAWAESSIPAVPNTMVERARWVTSARLDELELFLFGGLLHGPIRLLMSDLAGSQYPTPAMTAGQEVLRLAMSCPFVMTAVQWELARRPILLADVLSVTDLIPTAILEIVTWNDQRASSGWDRQSAENDHRHGRRQMLSDGFAVLSESLKGDAPSNAEVAAFLELYYGEAVLRRRRGDHDDDPLRELRSESVSWPYDRVQGVVDALRARPRTEYLDDPGTMATLELMANVPTVGRGHAQAVIDDYVARITPGDVNPASRGFSPRLCATLFGLSGIGTDLRTRFLFPFDAVALVKGAPEERRIRIASRTAQSLRAHMRVLARAIIGLERTAPTDLIEALTKAVRAGSAENLKKGRVAAFAPHFERSSWFMADDEPPLAADFAAVLRAAPTQTRRLVRALLETDEPYLLAQLADLGPPGLKAEMVARLGELAPDEAAEAMFATDDDARIDALFHAGLLEPVKAYVARQTERLKARSQPRPADMLALLGMEARLLAEEGDVEGLNRLRVPAGLPHHFDKEARDSLAFHGAVALCRRGRDSDLPAAGAVFRALQSRNNYARICQKNAIAIELGLLAEDRPFDRLGEEQAVVGRSLLFEAEELHEQLDVRQRSDVAATLARLHLMLGDAEAALWRLGEADLGEPALLAVKSVALHQLGRDREALGVLDDARKTWPDDGLVTAAARHLGGEVVNGAFVLVTGDVDPLPSIRNAFAMLRNLDLDRQARGWGYQTLDDLLLQMLTAAAAALFELRSAMRALSLDTKEDDITLVFQAIIRGQLDPLGWSIGDQPKGGYAASGNPGERDLIIRHSGLEVAAIEAVVCRNPMTYQTQVDDLRNHFIKLFGYSACRIRVHITYSRIADTTSVLKTLATIAREDAPPGWRYETHESMPRVANVPPGLVARYQDDGGASTMIFLVIDLGQTMQRGAAAAAGKKRLGVVDQTGQG